VYHTKGEFRFVVGGGPEKEYIISEYIVGMGGGGAWINKRDVTHFYY